jgi:hypothetical protein
MNKEEDDLQLGSARNSTIDLGAATWGSRSIVVRMGNETGSAQFVSADEWSSPSITQCLALVVRCLKSATDR